MRFALVALMLFASITLAHAGFQQVYHYVTISIRPDASAHVLEEFRLFIDGNDSLRFYDSVLGLNDISAWKNVTGLSNMRLHFDTRFARLSDIRIRSQQREGCNPFAGTCYGTVRAEYEVGSGGNGSFVGRTLAKPRTYNYTINPRALSYETSEQGDIFLSEGTRLTINLPNDATITSLNPFPDYFETTTLPVRGVSSLAWRGPNALAKFSLVFQREDNLGTEVLQFFSSLQGRIASLFSSLEGLALALMALIAISAFILLRRYNEARKRA